MAHAISQTAQGGHPVHDIIERLEKSAEGERVSVGDVVQAFGRRSFLPMLMVPALLVLSPLSGIPLFSSLCGITIAIVSGQMLWPGRDWLWLPAFLLRQDMRGEKARAALIKLYRFANWLDGHARERMCWLVLRPGSRIVEAVCFMCGCAMPFLEVVPFSSSFLGGAVVLMGMGLLARDGLIAAAGLAAISGILLAIYIAVTAFGV
ncbi:exopolysaccharide biosynthesis protein [Roseisalinus antarcticus]|uniref:Exopolysaccharide synthesis, ExoD n=1 Tax=Roseisalinus antarcticus TaxID=254357 RepID=A0A1Y5TY50_9RHOB|nr:exopolysaccharide biosynthesis protein [Roseisalinus antarcticus]SLN75601.1 Exopolysaccharide synthesis, ExoD [Roseisalinus antarcticus]